MWGGFPIDMPAADDPLRQVVKIDGISQTGVTGTFSPVEFFGAFGVRRATAPGRDRLLGENPEPNALRTAHLHGSALHRGRRAGRHDRDADSRRGAARVDYGVNNTSPTGGVLGTGYPGFRAGDLPLDIPPVPPGSPANVFPNVRQHLYHTAKVKGQFVALFSDDILVPLRPFFGVMAVAPPTGQFIGSAPDSPPPRRGPDSTQPYTSAATWTATSCARAPRCTPGVPERRADVLRRHPLGQGDAR